MQRGNSALGVCVFNTVPRSAEVSPPKKSRAKYSDEEDDSSSSEEEDDDDDDEPIGKAKAKPAAKAVAKPAAAKAPSQAARGRVGRLSGYWPDAPNDGGIIMVSVHDLRPTARGSAHDVSALP